MLKEICTKGHAIGRVCLQYGACYGAGFLILTLLNKNPSYYMLFREHPFVSKYIIDSIAFTIGLIFILRFSHGNLKAYGFTWKNQPLKIKYSVIAGITLGVLGIVINQISYTVFQIPKSIDSFSFINFLGMMSFQWIFVGVFEETITRGIIQTPLMNELKGTIRLYKWNFHLGSFITAFIFGAGHFWPHVLLGGSWISLPLHLLFASSYGLCSSYFFQESKSLVGPIMMHNLVDGMIYTYDFIV